MRKAANKKNKYINNTHKMILFSTALLLIISGAAMYLSQYYTQQKIADNNALSTNLMSDYLAEIVSDMTTLKYAFSNNISLVHTLKTILGSYEITFKERQSYSMVQTTLLAQMYSKPYVDSFYLYYTNNLQRFYVSDVSHNTSYVGTLSTHTDTDWFNSYQTAEATQRFWTERRELRSSSLDTIPTQPVISLYNCLYTVGSVHSSGIFVVNLNRNYLENALRELAAVGQSVFVFNEKNQLLLDVSSDILSAEMVVSEISPENPPQKVRINKTTYNVYSAQDMEMGWHLITLIDTSEQSAIFSIPSFAIIGICLVALLTQYFGSAYLARKNYLLAQDVIAVLETAERGESLPVLPRSNLDTDNLIRNALSNFIENNYYKTSWQEKQYHMQVLGLLALQNQMNPHFLFNTLHTITWKAIALTNGENDVSTLIEDLSSILRYSLRDPLQMATLKEEISIAECYVQIENIKQSDKFQHVEWICNVFPEQYKVPKLIIQPLIENCVLHAFPLQRKNCRIRVKVYEKKGTLIIRVSDNGIGIEKEKLTSLQKALSQISNEDKGTEHMGLINTHDRLQLLYGDMARMRVSSMTGYGTAVQISIVMTTES